MAWVSAAVVNAQKRHSIRAINDEWVTIENDDLPIITDAPTNATADDRRGSLGARSEGVSDRRMIKNQEVRVVENQRWCLSKGWSAPDPAECHAWTSPHGWRAVPPDLFEIPYNKERHNAYATPVTWWEVDYSAAPVEDEGSPAPQLAVC